MEKDIFGKANSHHLSVRVYYEDTDAGGVVYHSNYLNFMERARTEYLRELGFEQDRLVQDLGVAFVVHSVQLNYLKPARFNDLLKVQTSILGQSKTAFTFKQSVWRHNADCSNPTQLALGEVRLVCVTFDGFKPRAIPSVILNAIGGI